MIKSVFILSLTLSISAHARCVFDESKPESVYFLAACRVGENLGRLYDAKSIDFQAAVDICNYNLPGHLTTTSSFTTSSDQNWIIYKEAMASRSQFQVTAKNVMQSFCLKGLTDNLTSGSKESADKMPDRKMFIGEYKGTPGLFAISIGCAASGDRLNKAISDATMTCTNAGYSTCKPIADTAVARVDDYGRCFVSVGVLGSIL